MPEVEGRGAPLCKILPLRAQVHCKGSFAPAHHAGNYWRAKSKADSSPQDGRIILTSSIVGLEGNYGQSVRAHTHAHTRARTHSTSVRQPRPLQS